MTARALIRGRTLPALALWAAFSATAGGPGAVTAQTSDPQVLAAARTYTVVPGDTLDRVVQKTMGHSPLKLELLRTALVQANAQGIPAGRNPRLKAGTVLQLPDHDALLRAVVQSLVRQDPLVPQPPGAATIGEHRRHWVRYP